MKKKLLILIPLLFLICFSSPVKAMTEEEGTGADDPGLIEYVQRFNDLSGYLILITEAYNTSGVKSIYITALAICDNLNRTFKLKIYDSDEQAFIEFSNENGIGIKSRRLSVTPHPDFESLTWTAFATDMTGEIIYAQISLQYFYDEEYERDESGEEDPEDTVSKEEHDKLVKQAKLENRITGAIMAVVGVAVAIGYIRRMK